MKRIWVLGTALVAATVGALFYPFTLTEPNAEIEVRDMRYACGECYVRFKVLNVISGQDSKKFEGRDMAVSVNGYSSYLESYQDELAVKENCSWPHFRLKGQFKRQWINFFLYDGDGYKGEYFDATSGVAINKNPDCKLPKETRLP